MNPIGEEYPVIKSWREFRLKLQEGFNPSDTLSAYQQLLNIKQDSLVSTYPVNFERLPPLLQEKVYWKGLNREIRAERDMINPPGLIAIMDTSLKEKKQIFSLWHAMKSSSALDHSTSQQLFVSAAPNKLTGTYISSSSIFDRGKLNTRGNSIKHTISNSVRSSQLGGT